MLFTLARSCGLLKIPVEISEACDNKKWTGLDWTGKTWTELMKRGLIKHGVIKHGLT